ncbi:MAG: NUDIX domain-containing protein [Acidimicrobiales bacterium]|jgi:8-oxo-dGTP pyrophosphatase MutT (NUDIX family)|nr:NUDIX domain-containing protein [Acidimicrobiales bacterium]HJO79399.1 NUDIX domain-containing protein [Acidimicrobiales bacterium]|tara:strand:+ start:2922 stop:3785 length:864 start_codon:yes stop_codon:yes gene_type:complete
MAHLPAEVAAADLPGNGVPIQPAATVLIVDDKPDLQVVMMRRNVTSSFVADHTVFPGGQVEDSDSGPAWDPILVGTDETGTGMLPGIVDGGPGHRVAVVRETLEEVGLLIGTDEVRLLEHRGDLERGEVVFADAVVKTGGRLNLSGILPIARWVTPPGTNKRYDTYFFVARPGAVLEPVADGREAVDAGWVRPVEALERWESGELTMISPTISMLQLLSGFTSASDVLEAAGRGAEPVQARVLMDPPQGPGASRVWWPGDVGYDNAGMIEAMGWMWISRWDGVDSTP